MDDLLRLLREQATDAETSYWTVEINSEATHLIAATKAVSDSADAAWDTAAQLRDAIVGLGYKMYGACRVGIISEEGSGPDTGSLSKQMPISGWRGHVDLMVETK